jgi:hypothetical protein
MITHKTEPPTMMAVLRARKGVGASSRLNHAREPNGSMVGFVAVALIAVIVQAALSHEVAFMGF